MTSIDVAMVFSSLTLNYDFFDDFVDNFHSGFVISDCYTKIVVLDYLLV